MRAYSGSKRTRSRGMRWSRLGGRSMGACSCARARVVSSRSRPRGFDFLAIFLATLGNRFGSVEPNPGRRRRSTEPKVRGSNPLGRSHKRPANACLFMCADEPMSGFLRPLDREAGLGEPEALVADLNAQAVRAQLGLEAGPLRLDLCELVLDLEPGCALLSGRGPGGQCGDRRRDDSDPARRLRSLLPSMSASA